MPKRKQTLKTLILSSLILLLILSYPLDAKIANKIPKNIILYIGDGMGVAHITAGLTVNGSLHLQRFNSAGLITTHASDKFITDSAAGATAMATGEKTYNGAISVSPAGEPLKTVLEYAEEQGMSTGLVATCHITHATPACFVAHIDDRNKECLIAEQMVHSGVDVVFGGGLGYFLPKSTPGSKRNDENNLMVQWQSTHRIVLTADAFRSLDQPEKVVGLFYMDDPPRIEQREPELAALTKKAIEILSANPEGFFLMVEGSQIDWAAHDNDHTYLINEMIDFDRAVGIGMDFAVKDENTLIIVTSDHETGGYALEGGSIEHRVINRPDFSTTSHTGVMVPLFAHGPGSERFGGIHDNTFVGKSLITILTESLIQSSE